MVNYHSVILKEEGKKRLTKKQVLHFDKNGKFLKKEVKPAGEKKSAPKK
jgi:hypothetical protein